MISKQRVIELSLIPGVNRTFLINFLSTLDFESKEEALNALKLDLKTHKVNAKTIEVIQKAIEVNYQ